MAADQNRCVTHDREDPVTGNRPSTPQDSPATGAESLPTFDLDSLAMLCRAANLVRRNLDHHVLYDAHLTWTSWDVLTIITNQPGISTRDLTAVAVISKSSTTQICDQLVERALVYRTREDGDRRRTEVYPTARGSRLVADLIPRLTDAYERYLATGRAEVDETFRVLLRDLFVDPPLPGQPAERPRTGAS